MNFFNYVRAAAALDRSGMSRCLGDFPRQLKEAADIGRSSGLPSRVRGVRAVVVAGMGGSAIGGELLTNSLQGQLRVPLVVVRSYYLPAWVDSRTLVIAVSYSGNTEETMSALRDSLSREAKVAVITSGGVMKSLALREGLPLTVIPGGLPPRAALGYLLVPLLLMLERLGLVGPQEASLEESVNLLNRLGAAYGLSERRKGNSARDLAEKLEGKIPLIWGSALGTAAIAFRWKTQLLENSKVWAASGELPEMTHNEVMGWERGERSISRSFFGVFLADRGDHPRVKQRMEITRRLLAPVLAGCTTIRSKSGSPLARLFSLTYLGDWVSFYLALLNGVDPTPVASIEAIKAMMKGRPKQEVRLGKAPQEG